MKQDAFLRHKQFYRDKTSVSRVSVVTTERAQWASRPRFRWIFWLAVFLSTAILLGACKNNGAAESQITPSDTAGLAAFNAQKAADSLSAVQNGEVQGPGAVQDEGEAARSFTDEAAYTDNGNGAVKSVNDDNSGGEYIDDNSAGATAGNNEVADQTEISNPEATPAKKKKFSSAAKGAVIGAGSGAVLGAIISKKNRGLGAVIGAAVGGGAGYGIGKHKDNKRKAEEGQ